MDNTYIKTIFTIDGLSPAYIGYYIKRQSWNGWEFAHFTIDEATRLMHDYNKNAERAMLYDVTNDSFYLWNEGIEDYYIIKGYDMLTAEGIQHLYGIGAGFWIWSRIYAGGIRDVANETEEFIYYYNAFRYWDEDDHRRDDIFNYLLEEFKNLNTLVQVMNVMRDDDMPRELKFTKLQELVHI